MLRERLRRRGVRAALLGVIALSAAVLLAPAVLPAPLEPDRPELAHFADPPPSSTSVEVVPLPMGEARQPECGLVGGASCWHTVPLVQVAYLVRHPRGTFLIDSGLSSHFADDLARFSWWLRKPLSVKQRDHIAHALSSVGVSRPDFVILTHVHWDHTEGLTELSGVRVLTTPDDLAFVRSFHTGRGGEPVVMPDHLAQAALQPSAWDGPAYENFPHSHDVFGDGSVVLVPLPGHTPGAQGVFVNGVHGRRLFFVGDAVWHHDGIRDPSPRPGVASQLVDADGAQVSDTLWRLHHLARQRPELLIVPAHDGEALAQVQALVGK